MTEDPDIAALQAVHAALKPLDADARIKVLNAVRALLDIGHPVPSSETDESIPGGHESPASSSVQPVGTRPLSLVELVQDRNPQTNADYITLFAYYREKHESKPRFSRADLKGYFPQARQPVPGNFDRDFGKVLSYGWVHEDGDESYITSRGIEAVESGFAGDYKSLRVAKRATRRRPPKDQPRRSMSSKAKTSVSSTPTTASRTVKLHKQ